MSEGMDKRLSADIALDFPVEVDGQTITSLTMRRPKVRDMLKADRAKGGDFEKGLALLVDLTEQPREILEELDPSDLQKLDDQLSAFRGLTANRES